MFKAKIHQMMGYLVLFAGIVTSSSLFAQKQEVSLSQMLQDAQTHQQQFMPWQSQQQIIDLQSKQSQVWKNPTVNFEQKGFGNQDRETSIMFSQPLDVFGERKAKQTLVSLNREQMQLHQQMYQTQLNLVVKYVWSQLMLAQLEKTTVQQQLETSQEILSATEKRFQAGSIAQVDVERVRMNHVENQRLYQQAETQWRSAQKLTTSLLGYPVRSVSLTSPLWQQNLSNTIQQYQQNNVQLKAWQLQQQRYSAEQQYLSAMSRPNPTLNIGITQSKTIDTSDQTLTLGVTVPLAIFDRQQYNKQILQTKSDLLQQSGQFYQTQQKTRLEQLLLELAGYAQQWHHLQKVQLPLAQSVQQKTLLGFRAGKFSVTDVQQATKQLHETRLRQVQVLKEGWQRAIEIESLALGIDITTVANADALTNLQRSFWQNVQDLPTSY